MVTEWNNGSGIVTNNCILASSFSRHPHQVIEKKKMFRQRSTLYCTIGFSHSISRRNGKETVSHLAARRTRLYIMVHYLYHIGLKKKNFGQLRLGGSEVRGTIIKHVHDRCNLAPNERS